MRVSKCQPLTRPQKEVCSQSQTELLAQTTRSQGSLSPLQPTLVRALGINIYHKACNFHASRPPYMATEHRKIHVFNASI